MLNWLLIKRIIQFRGDYCKNLKPAYIQRASQVSIFNCLFIFNSLVITDDVLWVWLMHKRLGTQSLDLHLQRLTHALKEDEWMYLFNIHIYIYKICVFPILMNLKINLPELFLIDKRVSILNAREIMDIENGWWRKSLHLYTSLSVFVLIIS